MIPVSIINPLTGQALKINNKNELEISMISTPLLDESLLFSPFSMMLTNSAGSSDMRVNGSSTPAFFGIYSSNTEDILIRSLSFYISGLNLTLILFGALSALSNGLRFVHYTPSTGERTIQSGIKSNMDIVRLCNGNPAFGAGLDAFKANLTALGASSYMPVLDLATKYGYDQYGLLLKKGTGSRLGFYVNDNLSLGLDSFNIMANGTKL